MKITYFALFFAVYVMIPSSGNWNDFYLLTHTSRDTQLSRKLSMINAICASEIIAPDVVVQKLTHILSSTAIDRNFSITLRTASTVVSHYFFSLLLTRDVSWSEVITTNKAQRRGIGIRRTQLLNAINKNFVTIPRMKCPYAISRYSFSLLAQTRNLKSNQQDARRKARKVSVEISLRVQVYKQVKIKKSMIKTPMLSQEESYIPSLRSLRRIDMRTTRNPRACNQAAMYRRGYLRITYFTWPECRVVIENIYLALRKPNDACDDFWRHGVFAAQMRIDFSLSRPRAKTRDCQVILIENYLIICISARDLRHGDRRFDVRVGMRGSKSRVIGLTRNTTCSSRSLHNDQLIYHRR